MFKILTCGCGDLLVLRLPETGLTCQSPCLLHLPPTNLEWSACFFSLSWFSMYGGQCVRQQLASQQVYQRSESWERGILRRSNQLAFSSMWREVAPMLDACGPLCTDRDALKTPAALMCLFEELHTEHPGKEGKQAASTVGRLLLWAVQLATYAQRAAEARMTLGEEH